MQKQRSALPQGEGCYITAQMQQTILRASMDFSHNNEHDGTSNHQPHDCLLNRLFRRWSKKTSKLHVTGPCEEFTDDLWIPRTKGH